MRQPRRRRRACGSPGGGGEHTADPAAEASGRAGLDALSSVIRTHFIYEGKLIAALNGMNVPASQEQPAAFLRHDG